MGHFFFSCKFFFKDQFRQNKSIVVFPCLLSIFGNFFFVLPCGRYSIKQENKKRQKKNKNRVKWDRGRGKMEQQLSLKRQNYI